MHFAHYDRKTKNFDLNKLGTIEAIKKELPLGRFLCRLCHCIETQKEFKDNQSQTKPAIRVRERNRKFYNLVNAEKVRISCCARCKLQVDAKEEKIPFSYFEFDHLDGFIKIAGISSMISQNYKYTKQDFYDEMAKCQLVCSECHFIITAERRLAKKNKLRLFKDRQEKRPIYLAKLKKLFECCVI